MQHIANLFLLQFRAITVVALSRYKIRNNICDLRLSLEKKESSYFNTLLRGILEKILISFKFLLISYLFKFDFLKERILVLLFLMLILKTLHKLSCRENLVSVYSYKTEVKLRFANTCDNLSKKQLYQMKLAKTQLRVRFEASTYLGQFNFLSGTVFIHSR